MSASGPAQAGSPVENPHVRHIAVGADGSPASHAALRWAMREADNHHAEIEAILCWPADIWTGMADLFLPADLDVDPQKIVDGSVRIVAGELGFDAARVRTTISSEQPVAGLLAAARRADVLVIGATGHGALGGALLGSVSRALVTHAACTVIVVPDGEQLQRRNARVHPHSEANTVAPSQAQVWPAMGGTPVASERPAE